MDHEQIQAEQRQHGFQLNLKAFEPLHLLAAIQHQLEGADGQAQIREPHDIEAHLAGFGFADAQPDTGERQQTERQVDIEHPAPAVPLSEPAAQRGSQDRPDHHAHAPDRHGLAMLLHRVSVQQHRLGQRHQRGAEHPLQNAKQDHLIQRGGQPAQAGGHREPGHRPEEQPAPPQAAGHEPHRRRHDGGGHDVGGQHPGDLVGTGGQAALHVRQGHIGDGGVEHLHHRGQHDADGDQALVVKACHGRRWRPPVCRPPVCRPPVFRRTATPGYQW